MSINGSVVKPTEQMTERETMEAFIHGAKKACSAARELAKDCDDPSWETVAATLFAMQDGGKKLVEMKSMSRFETLMAANIKSAKYKPN